MTQNVSWDVVILVMMAAVVMGVTLGVIMYKVTR